MRRTVYGMRANRYYLLCSTIGLRSSTADNAYPGLMATIPLGGREERETPSARWAVCEEHPTGRCSLIAALLGGQLYRPRSLCGSGVPAGEILTPLLPPFPALQCNPGPQGSLARSFQSIPLAPSCSTHGAGTVGQYCSTGVRACPHPSPPDSSELDGVTRFDRHVPRTVRYSCRLIRCPLTAALPC